MNTRINTLLVAAAVFFTVALIAFNALADDFLNMREFRGNVCYDGDTCYVLAPEARPYPCVSPPSWYGWGATRGVSLNPSCLGGHGIGPSSANSMPPRCGSASPSRSP